MFTRSATNSPVRLSRAVAVAIPLLLGGYWPLLGLGFDWVPMAVRAGVSLCAGLLAMLWWDSATTRRERQWAVIFGGYLCLLLIPVMFATDTGAACKNWIRILFLLSFCLVLARAFRNPSTRRSFGLGAFLVSLLLSFYIIGCYVRFLGIVFPTYESTRIFKESLLYAWGVSLNPLGFSTAFFCILAACVLRPSWWLNATLVVVIAISTLFTGSRSPLALMLASIVGVVLIELAQRKTFMRWVCFCLVIPAILVVSANEVSSGLDMRKLSAITEGRVDLWKVALDKFLERPFTGYGADSWSTDLISRTPGHYELSGQLVEQHAGGYHNTYLTLLAEEGCFVFLFALFMVWSGYRTIARTLPCVDGQKWRRWIYMFGLLFLVCRGFIEVPGIFGYGEDPAEFLAYALIALIISVEALTSRDLVCVSGAHRIVPGSVRFAQ